MCLTPGLHDTYKGAGLSPALLHADACTALPPSAMKLWRHAFQQDDIGLGGMLDENRVCCRGEMLSAAQEQPEQWVCQQGLNQSDAVPGECGSRDVLLRDGKGRCQLWPSVPSMAAAASAACGTETQPAGSGGTLVS